MYSIEMNPSVLKFPGYVFSLGYLFHLVLDTWPSSSPNFPLQAMENRLHLRKIQKHKIPGLNSLLKDLSLYVNSMGSFAHIIRQLN